MHQQACQDDGCPGRHAAQGEGVSLVYGDRKDDGQDHLSQQGLDGRLDQDLPPADLVHKEDAEDGPQLLRACAKVWNMELLRSREGAAGPWGSAHLDGPHNDSREERAGLAVELAAQALEDERREENDGVDASPLQAREASRSGQEVACFTCHEAKIWPNACEQQ